MQGGLAKLVGHVLHKVPCSRAEEPEAEYWVAPDADVAANGVF